MMSPRQAIERLKLVQCLAADLGPFYREVLPQWHATARAVAVATMAGMRPEEVASEVWTERTAELAEAVVAEFIAEDAVAGVAIRLETGNEEEADPTEINVVDPKYFRIGEVAISDVEEWVAAGRDGTAPEGVGKRLDSRDDRKSNLQIAWRVMHAMRLGKGDGLARAIGRFKAWETGLDMDRVLAQILRDWTEVFLVMARQDLEGWLCRMVEGG